MLNLEGELGVLRQNGKQVAGVFDWNIRAILQANTTGGIKEYKPVKHIDARSYWLLEPVRDNVYQAEFYQVINDNLVLMDCGKVVAEFPDSRTLDRRLEAPIAMRWLGVDY